MVKMNGSKVVDLPSSRPKHRDASQTGTPSTGVLDTDPYVVRRKREKEVAAVWYLFSGEISGTSLF
jgi:hypothetical protein